MNQTPHRRRLAAQTAALALSGALVAGAAAPAHALTMRKATFVCPLDGQTFTATVVNSYTRFGVRLDLRPYGALMAPMPMPVCPGNGFVMYKRKFTEAEIAKIKTIVFTDAYRAERKANTDYHMAAYIRQRMGASDLTLGYLHMRAYWEAENQRKADLQKRYMALSLERLAKFAAAHKERDRKWWTAQLLAANLERKLGRFDAASKRLAALPLNTLPKTSVLHRVHAQIAGWTAKRDVKPQKFVAKKK